MGSETNVKPCEKPTGRCLTPLACGTECLHASRVAAPPQGRETTRDDGGMTGRYLIVNRATGQVVTDVDEWEEATALREGCEQDSPSHAYAIAEVRRAVALSSDAIARNYVPENNGGMPCGPALAVLSLADRVALVEAGIALATPTPTADVQAVVERLKLALVGTEWAENFDGVPRRVVFASADCRTLLAHLQRGTP